MKEIVFLDANTIWHQRFAEALAEKVKVTVVNPRKGLMPSIRHTQDHGTKKFTVTLPPGWASGTALLGQRILARLIGSFARSMTSTPVVVITSPAYAPLVAMLDRQLDVVSYTADDYRNYDSWGGASVVDKERKVYRRSALSIFVSESLRQRAVQEFGLHPGLTTVSPNASEPRFAYRSYQRRSVQFGQHGPVVGILGGLSQRLDLEAIARAARSPAIKKFLVAGPVGDDILARYPIFASNKVIVTGYVPHEDMHLHAAAMDVAVIAYARSELNRHCSPMRFYDHLATGIPIVALEGCDQIDRSAYPGVTVVRREHLVTAIETAIALRLGLRHEPPPDCFWQSRAKLVIEAIESAIDDKLSPHPTV